jgi:hypothetical protein
MKYISKFINKLMRKEIPKKLGRWNIENCNKKIDNKIDLSNEDHCGPCGQYAINKIEMKMKDIMKSKTMKTEKK